MRSKGWMRRALLFVGWGCVPVAAHAGGPRFVSGSNWWVNPVQPVAFYTSSPAYYTDPGDLNATVSHAQADAMVAAAAAAWNVPTSAIVLQQGGELAEHVSSANVYFDGSEMVFPADVSATNYENIPIAVIYDTDGSVIDTLLGEGASDPSGCRQTGVVESVDSIGLEAKIHHAMLILNGRCVGATAQQLTQMQYQLERAFGRVLGLAWSQVNDNVFTGATPPSALQISYWPIMHPMDVLCGAYSYQCITNPFQLRADDLSALALLYPVTNSNLMGNYNGSTKQLSSVQAVNLTGQTEFPTGQGMELLNVTVTYQPQGAQTVQLTSGVTGQLFAQNTGNPVTGPESFSNDVGATWPDGEGRTSIPRTPDAYVANLYMVSEAIDPLYTGDYAIAPYQRPPIAPSGSPQTMIDWSATAGTGNFYKVAAWDAPSDCPGSGDGTQSAPAQSDASGWWGGQLCPVGHSSWWSVHINPGSTWTIEVTALDETGAPTMNKAQPVLGVWNTGDGGLPTVASQPFSMNALQPGVTQLQMLASTTAKNYTFVVADQYGAGRPDFAYRARVLYAHSVSPAHVSTGGGQIVIAGEGFRQGNQVVVNGVPATVVISSANQIVARVPSMATAGASFGTPVDVMVMDVATGGTTDVGSGFSYSNVQPGIAVLVSSPASLETSVTAAKAFAVRLLEPDGVTPIIGEPVQVSVVSGSATLGACGGAATCTLVTDATGLVQTTVTGRGAGPVVLNATDVNGGAGVQVTVIDEDPVRAVSIATAPIYVAAGASTNWTISLAATQDGLAAVGVPVVWTASSGLSVSGGGLTNGSGLAAPTVTATQIPAGAGTVTGCLWGTVCTSWTVTAVDASRWRITVSTGAAQSVSAGTALGPVSLGVTDTVGHALQGATVSVYQTVDAWEGACLSQGRCAASPVLASGKSSTVSDNNGNVSITPMELPGLPQVVNIAAVTGTQGFVSISLPVTP
ncbi:MAG TPA: IPT/TIG domain-containing protein [Bryocella sp.]|nr:IPT/TIG domain-containing protein [Bryocella sp.]